MKEIALVTMIATDGGDELVLVGYNDFDEAARKVADLISVYGPYYYVQYVELI